MAVNSIAQWGGEVGRARFNGTDLPDELPEAVMNGLADGLMTDKEKKPPALVIHEKLHTAVTTTSAKWQLSG